jgi:hypothetical protein
MSNGRFHPKISAPSSGVRFPLLGTKTPRADLILSNSASQTFVVFAVILFQLRRLSKGFFAFSNHAAIAAAITLALHGELSKLSFDFFKRATSAPAGKNGPHNISAELMRKNFFKFFF